MKRLSEALQHQNHVKPEDIDNGTYTCLWYSHILELEDGRMVYVPIGVRHPRKAAKPEQFRFEDGHVYTDDGMDLTKDERF